MKARNKATGVLLDVIPKSNPNARSMGDNLYVGDGIIYRESELDFVNVESPIDWEQRRYEIAKSAIQGILSNQHQVDYALSEVDYGDGKHTCPIAFAQYAVACANALIEELKKEEK